MKLIRCISSPKGYRLDGKFFPGNAWTPVEEFTEAQQACKRLLCIDADPSDPALRPYPIDSADAQLKDMPTLDGLATSIAELQAESAELKAENAALKAEQGPLNKKVSALESDLSAAETRIGVLEKAAKDSAKASTKGQSAAPVAAEPAPSAPATAPTETITTG